jgi:CO/xanthine dehydrogenase FAD-binding subunit
VKSFEYTHAESVAQALAQLRAPGVVPKAGGVDLVDRIIVHPSTVATALLAYGAAVTIAGGSGERGGRSTSSSSRRAPTRRARTCAPATS